MCTYTPPPRDPYRPNGNEPEEWYERRDWTDRLVCFLAATGATVWTIAIWALITWLLVTFC